MSAPLSCRVLDTKGSRFTLLEPVRSSWYSGSRGLQIRPVTPVLATTVARNLGRARAQEAIRVSFSHPTLGSCSGPEHRPYRIIHGQHYARGAEPASGRPCRAGCAQAEAVSDTDADTYPVAVAHSDTDADLR